MTEQPTYAGYSADALRKLAQGATPGPWRAVQLEGFGAMRFIVTESPERRAQLYRVVAILENPGTFDGDMFIAASREAIPDLLAHIARLEADNARLRGALDSTYDLARRFALRLGDAGLYGTPDDLQGGQNQIAFAGVRLALEEARDAE